MTGTGERSELDRYASGDYSFWSRVFEPASETLTEVADVSAADRVLDVAAGNTARAAARLGAIVTALDRGNTVEPERCSSEQVVSGFALRLRR